MVRRRSQTGVGSAAAETLPDPTAETSGLLAARGSFTSTFELAGEDLSQDGEGSQGGSVSGLVVRTFVEHKLAIGGLVILTLIAGFCFIGPFFYHTNQELTNLSLVTRPPSGQDVLGTDPNGLDELGRLMVGGRSSLTVGVSAAVVATLIGVLWGATAGFVGGALDAVMMRIVDTVIAIPTILLLIVLTQLYTPNKTLLIFLIAGVAWLTPARLVRAETLSLRTRGYVDAARAMGEHRRRLIVRHIIPNAAGTIIVSATFQVADAILLLAALGYLGLGIHFPDADWGSMLSDGSQYLFNGYWWLIVPPALALVLVVVAINSIGDALRDSLEVRLQRR